MVSEDRNGDSSSQAGCIDCGSASERSFDELTKALIDGSLSRGQALRLMAGALFGGVMASIPGVAWAQQGGGGCPLDCPEGFNCRLARSSPDSPRTAFCCVEGRDGRYYPGTPYCCQPEEIVGGQCCHPPVFEPCGGVCCSAGQCLNGSCCEFGQICGDTCCPLDWTCVNGTCVCPRVVCGNDCCPEGHTCATYPEGHQNCCPLEAVCPGTDGDICCIAYAGPLACCNGGCCREGEECINGQCSCGGGPSCPEGEFCAGGTCCPFEEWCVLGGSSTPVHNTVCCPEGTVCTGFCYGGGSPTCEGAECCPRERVCGNPSPNVLGAICCPEGTRCDLNNTECVCKPSGDCGACPAERICRSFWTGDPICCPLGRICDSNGVGCVWP